MRISGCVQILLIGASLLAGCTGATPGGPTPPTDVTERAPSRTLVMVVKREPVNLSPKLKQETSLTATKRLFNAGLALIGDGSAPKPYLAEALPELRTDSWRVFPDGRMETTYKLRSALQWQDGRPFSAEDFVFAWRVYTTPGVDVTLQTPQDRIEEVVAPEPSTVLIRWARLYPEAGRLSYGDFPPLPRHLLERSFREDPIETFLAQTYWTRDYIGVGPYRLERWEPGTFVEGTAFSGHALGAPRIDRIQVLFIPDENTGLAQLLSGAAHVAFAGGISLEQAIVLQREWGAGQVGTVGLRAGDPIFWQVQFRPELVSPQALLDLRVRRALAHALDKQTFVDLQYGLSAPADTMISREEPWYPAVDRAIVKYPFDLRRAEALLFEAGFAKGTDGLYTGSGGRLNPEVRWNATAANNLEGAILAEGWRRADIDASASVFPETRLPDGEFRASYPSLQWGGPGEARKLVSSAIPSAANRWVGTNRGGWASARYDRLFDAFNTTLDFTERSQEMADMMKLISEEVPVFTTYHNAVVGMPRIAALAGIVEAAGADATWNVHEWYWR